MFKEVNVKRILVLAGVIAVGLAQPAAVGIADCRFPGRIDASHGGASSGEEG
jgi:hypothetical protein